MFLGLLIVAMAIGAGAAGAWLYVGGSLILAVAIYSLAATFFVLGASILSFLFAHHNADTACGPVEALHPAE